MTVISVGAAPTRTAGQEPVVALGNFDGVHTGHRRLLSAAVEEAERRGTAPAVWTFTSLAKEDAAIPALTTAEDKLRLIGEAGVGLVFEARFADVRDWSPERFAAHLAEEIGAVHVVCGFNFRFGRGGAGDAETLRALLAERGISLTVVPPVLTGGEPVSSTRIRAAVEAGDMETAALLLGRRFSVALPVVHGSELGRTIGLPTLNQDFPAGLIIPRSGIYATLCETGGAVRIGVTNVGVRPTVCTNGTVNCETHLLDFAGDLYGRTVRVSFCTRLRDEKRFPSLSALKDAIENDARTARRLLTDELRRIEDLT